MNRLAAIAAAALATLAPTQDDEDRRMEWWRGARFGLFIHWALYPILEGEEEGSTGHAEWIRETARIPLGTYERLLERFDPVKFDADEWARAAKAAGMRYLVVIVNNRVEVHRGGMEGFSRAAEAAGDFATPEQEIPPTGLPGVDWETCMTMNDQWGWNARDANWKSTEDLVRKLVDIASKGGNFLLNVGPKPDGTFPAESLERLREIGEWMSANGEAIHGTTASPFESLPWGRCTVKRKRDTTRLNLHVFEWSEDGRLLVPGIENEPRRAFLLAEPGTPLAFAPIRLRPRRHDARGGARHGVVEKTGAISLQAGLHPIEVAWFNKTGGAHLEVASNR